MIVQELKKTRGFKYTGLNEKTRDRRNQSGSDTKGVNRDTINSRK